MATAATSVGNVASAVTSTGPPVAIASPAGSNGYTMLDSNGHVYNFNTTYYGGAPTGASLPFVAMAYTPTGKGYALLDRVGHVYNYGDSAYKGGAPTGATLPFVSIAYKPGTLGYTLMDSAGHIYNYGTTYLGGSPAGATQPFRALQYTYTGKGYTLMDSVGHVYNYGDSVYKGGAPTGASLPMSDLEYKPGTYAYTELDATGHIYNYGTTYLGGNPTGSTAPFVGFVYTPTGNGYTLADAVGHIYNYGDSHYFGGLEQPPLGMFATVVGPARTESTRTGIPVSVMLTQSDNETHNWTSGWWINSNNPAGIGVTGAPGVGNVYPTQAAGWTDYANKLLGQGEAGQQQFVADLNAGAMPLQLLKDIEASPWATGHYGGNGLELAYPRFAPYDNPNLVVPPNAPVP